MASLLQSPVLSPLRAGRAGGGVAPVGGNVAAPNQAPNRKNTSCSSQLITPPFTGLHLQKGARGGSRSFGVCRRPVLPPPVLCFGSGGGAGSGSRRDETGVEDEDLDIDALLMRSQDKLVVDVQPLQEARRVEEEAVRKGREMLFQQFCLHLGLTPQGLRAMWRARGGGRGRGDGGDGGGAEERLRLVREFLEEEWGWRYRPLSPRAAVEMLDEHMGSLEEIAAAAARPPARTTTIATAARPPRLFPNWWP